MIGILILAFWQRRYTGYPSPTSGLVEQISSTSGLVEQISSTSGLVQQPEKFSWVVNDKNVNDVLCSF
jgi:hypothetical protein